MTTQAVKDWLVSSFNNSIAAAPGVYPFQACCGVLYNAGFSSANLTIVEDRPSDKVEVLTHAAIVLDDTQENEPITKGNGAQGPIWVTQQFELYIYWMADYVNAVYTSETGASGSNRAFRKLVNAVKRTIRLAAYQSTAAGAGFIRAAAWPLTDPDTAEPSRVLGQQLGLQVYKVPVSLAENGVNRFYSCRIDCQVTEELTAAGT